jgi:2-keto-4-pentenoate hydratase/2-oxohepta-3-ene-1,7-dioic acid hydratase in catechol pathway
MTAMAFARASRKSFTAFGFTSAQLRVKIQKPKIMLSCTSEEKSASKALDHIWGYGVGIDLTRRDLQLDARDKGRPWDWGKAFDLSAPCAPLHRASNIGHLSSGRIWLAVNGVVKQNADLGELIWSIPDIVATLSQSMTLQPGDLIMTGTPAGVGAIVPGDIVTGGIEGLGDIDITIAERVGIWHDGHLPRNASADRYRPADEQCSRGRAD